MADYINKNILSQAYVHIEPQAFETEEDLENFKINLTEFTESRVAFFYHQTFQYKLNLKVVP